MSNRLLVVVALCDFAAMVGAMVTADARWFVVTMFSCVFTIQALRDRAVKTRSPRA